MLKNSIASICFFFMSTLIFAENEKFRILDDGGLVEFTNPVSLKGTAVATWKRRRLDDDITYTLQLYIVTESGQIDEDLVPLLYEQELPNPVVINLNYTDYAKGRLAAIKTIFGSKQYDEITTNVGTYQKKGVFKINKLMTISECDNRDFYGVFSDFESEQNTPDINISAIDKSCS